MLFLFMFFFQLRYGFSLRLVNFNYGSCDVADVVRIHNFPLRIHYNTKPLEWCPFELIRACVDGWPEKSTAGKLTSQHQPQHPSTSTSVHKL